MAREKPVSSTTVETLVPQWQPVDNTSGALAYAAGKIASPKIEFRALRIDLVAPDLRIVVRDGAFGDDSTLSTRVSSFVRDNGLLAGINALPFRPVSGREGEVRTNIGIVVSEGKMLSPPHSGYASLVFYTDGSVSIVNQSEIRSVENIENAVGGFHQVLKAGGLTGRVLNREDRHPRSAAGISSDGQYLYLLVIDGRRIGSIGCTEAETALLLRALGSWDGINLDGGGSSSLALRYPDNKIRVVNTPIHGDIPGRERAVAGCLGVVLNPSTEK